MQFYVLIPARLESSRLENKMLCDIQGVPLVIRTAKQAQKSAAKKVFIATDSDKIAQTASQYGIASIRTQQHQTGTDRIAEAASQLELDPTDIIVNVQGDEPLIAPLLINQVAQRLYHDPDASMATVAAPLTTMRSLMDPNIVKVVCNNQQQALYFSRAPIPWARDQFDADQNNSPNTPPPQALHHIGIYAYRNHFLQRFPTLAAGQLERIESLEQLRALEHGFIISVHLSPTAPAPGVDTPADLEKVRQLLAPQG